MLVDGTSRVRVVDRQRDEIAHDLGTHVRLMKLFPMCGCGCVVPEDDYRRFHLRYYLPREYFVDARKKIDKLLVMTNGLDEVADYSLYDEMGGRFASRGLAAVLLPLPDHLNRHTRFRIASPDDRQRRERPSDIIMREPITLYERFLQFKGELSQLRAHMGGRCPAGGEGPCSFYRRLFTPAARISYLGFSLGAATLLCDFLEEEEGLNACFLLNGAIKLPDVVGRKMFPKGWGPFIKRLLTEFRKQPQPASWLFEEIFLGQYILDTPDLLRRHGRRVLFIYGGRDSFASHRNIMAITPEAWGCGLLVLPGINHFLTIDEEWKKWIELVVKLISDFEENAARRIITEEGLRLEAPAVGVIHGTELREREEQFYRASLLGLPQRIAELEAEKKRLQEFVETTRLEELPLGSMLFKQKLISFEELNSALAGQCGPKKVRIGDIVVDELRLVSRERVEELASMQSHPKADLCAAPA